MPAFCNASLLIVSLALSFLLSSTLLTLPPHSASLLSPLKLFYLFYLYVNVPNGIGLFCLCNHLPLVFILATPFYWKANLSNNSTVHMLDKSKYCVVVIASWLYEDQVSWSLGLGVLLETTYFCVPKYGCKGACNLWTDVGHWKCIRMSFCRP